MSCHEKTFLYTCIAKKGEDQLCGNCAADNRHYFRSIFRPPDKSVYWKIILYFSLNQAGGVPCSLTNSTGKGRVTVLYYKWPTFTVKNRL